MTVPLTVVYVQFDSVAIFPDRRGYLHSTFYVPALPIVFTLLVLFQNTLLAQAPEGTIRGVVRDVTGAVVTKTTVRIKAAAVLGRAGRGDEAVTRPVLHNQSRAWRLRDRGVCP